MPKKTEKKLKKKPVPAKKKAAKPAKKIPAKKAAKSVPAKKTAKKVAATGVKAHGKAAAAPKKGLAKKADAKRPELKKAPVVPKVPPRPAPVPEKAKKAKKEPVVKGGEKPPQASEESEAPNAEEEAPAEIVLTDADGRRYCRVKDCDQLAVVDGYCRFHYLLYWKKIQIRKKILSEGKLERYIEELTARYPDKFLDMLRKDLRSEKEFLAAIQELEIDESAVDSEFEDESANYIEEVRGMGEGGGARDEEDF